MSTRTANRLVARAALAIGDFLHVGEDDVYALVVGRAGPTSAHVMYNTGRVAKLDNLDRSVYVAVSVPVEDFGANDLAGYVIEQEAEARAAQARAERLRLAVEGVRQIQANQPGAAAAFAEAIGRR